MADVYNWQLGRKMEYIYEEHHPRKQISWVYDLNKCIGCHTCSLGCKTTWTSGRGQEYMFWNSVETKPYGYWPLGWDVRLLEVLGVQEWKGDKYNGKTIFEAAGPEKAFLGFLPETEDWAYPNLGEDDLSSPVEKGSHFSLPHIAWMFYFPRTCNHCTYPACLAACPRKAIYKREEDGVVLIDQHRCRGYRECIRACPYKRPMFNTVSKVSEKCIACYPALAEGVQSRCVVNCIGKIRIQGFKNRHDKPDPENPIDFLVHFKKIGLPIYPQFGLEPNLYYIPPIHVPIPYLRQMFGPGAAQAVATYQRMREGKEPEIQAILHLMTSTEYIVTRFLVKGSEVIGYDEKQKEVVRVPVREPIHVRPHYDEKLAVYRHNIT
ncbi:MAG: dehydrogenase [Armatimonadetes bacterium]|nr:dehydrogenase [Armatimonadota bacterium]